MRNQLPQTQIAYWGFRGGLNLTTPPLTLPPELLQDSENFEADVNGGYRRIAGYERFDGNSQPHDQTYYTIPCTVTGVVTQGATLTGATSGATSTVIGAGTGVIYVAKITGTYNGTEELQISAVTVATQTSAAYSGGALSQSDEVILKNRAADVYRALIAAVPGSGAIRGVWIYLDTVYAFRDNAGGTACDMFKSTASGWSQITFGRELTFTAGNASWADGQTVTQGGVSGVIARVVVQGGDFSTGDASGRLILSSVAGGAFAAGAITSSGGGTATSGGADTAITLAAGGRYEFVNWNFGQGLRMYGASGTHRAFEWDGTVFVPLVTGMGPDTPKFIAAHKNHLFLSFDASVQHSAIADPYVWDPVLGAAELSAGDTVAGFLPQPGSEGNASMTIVTRNRSLVLYGNDINDWNLITYSYESGALPYTIQSIGQALVVDDRGIVAVGRTQAFGNFESAAISNPIQPWIREKKTRVIASCINRERSQYRLFFSDKYALYITIDGQSAQIMPQLFTDDVKCIVCGEFSDGSEQTYFGSSDGFVYRLDVGTSFDGDAIGWRFKTAFNHFKSPRVRKNFRKLVLEITGSSYASFSIATDMDYSSTAMNQSGITGVTSNLAPTYWDAFTWDSFYWDGRTLAPSEIKLAGTAENMAILLTGSSDEIDQFTITGAIVYYTPRRLMR